MNPNVMILMLKYTDVLGRFEIFKQSFLSLLETTNRKYPIIILDNGKDTENYCQKMMKNNEIYGYVNYPNIGLEARNYGFELQEKPDYIVIVDDDMLYTNGWLEEGISILREFEDLKITCSPFCHRYHTKRKFQRGKLGEYSLNARCGSGCRIYRYRDYLEIGKYEPWKYRKSFRTNGKLYVDRMSENYSVVLLKKKALHMGDHSISCENQKAF